MLKVQLLRDNLYLCKASKDLWPVLLVAMVPQVTLPECPVLGPAHIPKVNIPFMGVFYWLR